MIGMTLRLTQMRGSRAQPASAHASRKSAICSACSSSNGTPGVLEQQRRAHQVHAVAAAHSAVSRVPAPHQIRSGRPGDCGWIGSIAVDGLPAASALGDAGAVDRGPEQLGLRAREVGVGLALGRDVAERLGPRTPARVSRG